MSGNLRGYVVRNHRSVADAAVTIIGSPGPHIDIAPLTDSDGWFALDDLQAGHWRLRAHAPDGATGEASVDIWDDSLSEVTIAIGAGNEPVLEMWQEPDIYREPDSGEPDIYREPDKGEAKPNGSSPPRSSIEDEPSNGQPIERASRSVPAKARRSQAQNRSPGKIVGQVTDADTGEPVADALVVVTDGPGPLPDGAVTTGADGTFVIPAMSPGDWSLRVDAANDDRYGELLVAVKSRRRVDVTIALGSGLSTQ